MKRVVGYEANLSNDVLEGTFTGDPTTKKWNVKVGNVDITDKDALKSRAVIIQQTIDANKEALRFYNECLRIIDSLDGTKPLRVVKPKASTNGASAPGN